VIPNHVNVYCLWLYSSLIVHTGIRLIHCIISQNILLTVLLVPSKKEKEKKVQKPRGLYNVFAQRALESKTIKSRRKHCPEMKRTK